MITIEECRKTLSQEAESYSPQELENILEFLKILSDISLNQYRRSHGESNFIHQS
jgi:hypothetical protein